MKKEVLRYAWGDSTLGSFMVATSDRGLVAIEFGRPEGNLPSALRDRFTDADLVEDPIGMAAVVRRVAGLIEQPETSADLAVDPRGSELERRVWNALREIPAGETASYGEIAARIGSPRQAREVGEACAANALAVVVPCHRVVKKDGSLSGYRWGVARKRALIEREQRAAFHLTG